MLELLIAVASVSLQDAALDRIAERVDRSTNASEQEQREAWWEGRRAGPALLKALAARFPGERRDGHCGFSTREERDLSSGVICMMMSFGEPAVEHLTPLLKHRALDTRRIAAVTLGQMRCASAVSALIEAMTDPDALICATAHRALKLITLRDLPDLADYRAWHAEHGKKPRLQWIRDAFLVRERARVSVEEALSAATLLPSAERFECLVRAYAELDWPGALQRLVWTAGQIAPDDRAAWMKIAACPREERERLIALCQGRGTDAPYRYFTGRERGIVLARNPAATLDLMEAMGDSELIRTALPYVVTEATFDRATELVRRRGLKWDLPWAAGLHPDVVPKLIERVAAGDPGPSHAYSITLVWLARKKHVPRLLEAYERGAESGRGTLLMALGETGDERAWSAIEPLFEDPKRSHWGAVALLNFPGEKATGVLRQLLKSPQLHTRAIAARALADRGDLSGVEAILPDLDRERTGSEDMRLCHRLSEIVGRNLEPNPKWAEWVKEWWPKNRDRTRVEILIDGWRETGSAYIGELTALHVGAWRTTANPLWSLAQTDLRGIETNASPQDRLAEELKRLRAWAERTKFCFGDDTGRVPYDWGEPPWWKELER